MGELAIPGQRNALIASQGFNVVDALTNPQLMQALTTFAENMAKAHVTIPKHLHNKPSDCLAITLQSMRWGMDPFVVAGKTAVINGNLSYEAQLVVAVLKSSGSVRGRPHYEYRGTGEDLECRAGFIPAGEDQVVWTEWLSKRSVKVRNSPLWTANDKQQMGYLQGRNWARLYSPDALLGVYTQDEMMDAADPTHAGTRHMGNVDEVQRPATVAELPLYEAAKFEQSFKGWAGAISSGKKTAQQLIDWIQTKARLTDDQIKRLRAVKVAQAAEVVDASTGEITDQDASQGADTDAHPLEVAMNKATTRDDLDVLADRISAEAGNAEWEEYLRTVYHANVDRLDR